VGADVPCVVLKLVVLVVIELGVRTVLLVLHKAHVLWHVQTLAEVLDVQAQVHNHLLTVVRVAVADQEGACHATDDAFLKLELLLDVLIAKELLALQEQLIIFSPELLDQPLAKERIVHLTFFRLDVNRHRNGRVARVNLLNGAYQAELIEVQAQGLLSLLQLALRPVPHPEIQCREWVSLISLLHQQTEGHNLWLLTVNFIPRARLIVKFNAFNFTHGDQHVNLAHGAVNPKLPQVLVDVNLKLLR
jgi:hypothetical protein